MPVPPNKTLELSLDLERLVGVDSPFGRLPVGQVYRRTRPGLRPVDLRFDGSDDLMAALDGLYRGTAPPLVLAAAGDALRRFLLPAGWASDEAVITDALARGTPIRLTIRSGAVEILGLPWELLTLGETGVALGRRRGVTIRSTWTGASPGSPAVLPRPEGGRMALAGSAAGGAVPTSEVAERILRASEASGIPFSADRDLWPEPTLRDLDTHLAQDTPVLLHLLAHGAGGGTVALATEQADAVARVDGPTLAATLAPWTGTLRAVVLSMCQSGEAGSGALGGIGLALHRAGVEVVIAARFPLSLASAVDFSAAFYAALLGDLASVEDAFAAGRDALSADPSSTDWASLQLFAHPGRGCRPVVVRPFRGLLGYGSSNRRLFFGRDRERDRLLDRVNQAGTEALPPFQAIIGASGSGKSSLLHAGLLPALAGWEVATLRPGLLSPEQTWARLAQLQGAPAGRRLVLVDQVEDLFAAFPAGPDQERFVRALWQIAQPGRVVLIALRVDALARCGSLRVEDGLGLDAVLYDERHRMFLAQASAAELRQVIEGPPRRVGLEIEAGLTDALLADVAGLEAALPLLASTLDALWCRRQDDTLCHATYRELGGVEGALAKGAELLLASLTPEVRAAAERMLLSLVEPAAGGGNLRRLVALDELRPAEGADPFDQALAALLSARIVVSEAAPDAPERAILSLAHHALLTRWPALAARIDAERDAQVALREVQRWAGEWQSHRGDPDGGEPFLLMGSRLGYAEELVRRRAGEMGAPLVALIAASRARDDLNRRRALAEAEAREAAARRARDAALLATARALQGEDPTRALLVLREVQGETPGAGWVQAALSLLSSPIYSQTVDVGADLIDLGLALDPTGPRVAVPQGDALLLLGLDGTEVGRFVGAAGALTFAGFSPDGAWLIAGGKDGAVWIWPRTGGAPRALRGHEGPVLHAAFQADSGRFVTGSEDGTARLWSISGSSLAVLACPSAVRRVALHPRGEAVATVGDDPAVRVWRLSPRPVSERLGRCEGDLRCVTFRPDGRALLTGSADGLARIWTGAGAAPVVLAGHTGEVLSVGYRPDGAAMVTAGADRGVRLWDAAGQPDRVLRGANGVVLFACFTADGRALWTSERGGVLRSWSRGEGAGGAPRIHGIAGARLVSAEMNAAQDRLLLAGEGGRMRLLSPETDQDVPGGTSDLSPEGVLPGDTESAVLREARLSPAGDEALVLFDRATLRWAPGAAARPMGTRAQVAAWRPRGGDLAIADPGSGAIRVLPAGTRLQGHSNLVLDLRWSADGRRLLSRGADRRVCIWEPDAGVLLATMQRSVGGPAGFPVAADLSSDGQWVIAVEADGQVRALALEGEPAIRTIGRLNARPVAAALCEARGCGVVLDDEGGLSAWRLDGGGAADRAQIDEGGATALSAQPGGAWVLIWGRSGRAWLWAPRESVTPFCLPCPSPVRSARFSPSGDAVLLACEDGRARIWPLRAAGLQEALRRATSAALSKAERAALLGDVMDSLSA